MTNSSAAAHVDATTAADPAGRIRCSMPGAIEVHHGGDGSTGAWAPTQAPHTDPTDRQRCPMCTPSGRHVAPVHEIAVAAPRPARPVVAVDVDGVLNPDDPTTAERLGYRPHHYAGPDPAGNPVTGTVWLHPDHGAWLAELVSAGAELVWCTSWGPLAATFIASRLGLPTDLAVIDVTAAGVRWGHQLKLFDLYQRTGARPVAVLDDEFGGKDPDQARPRTRSGVATLLVPVDPSTGLRRADVETVLAWLEDVTRHHDRSPVT